MIVRITNTFINRLIFVLLIIPIPIIVWKLSHYEYTIQQFTNSAITNYDLKISYEIPRQLIGKNSTIHFDVPIQSTHQHFKKEQLSSSDFNLQLTPHLDHLSYELSGAPLPKHIQYTCQFYSEPIFYRIGSTIRVNTSTNKAIRFKRFKMEANSISNDAQFEIWLKSNNIIFQKVVGYNLNSSCATPIHWYEISVGKHWIPFSVDHQFQASLPAHFLKYGNASNELLQSTINHIHITTKKHKIIHPKTIEKLEKNGFNLLFFNRIIEENNLPFELLSIILLTPLAALIIVLIRNTIGMSTFGLFLPMLLAMSFMTTGFLIGSILFMTIIALISLVHYPLEKFELLNLPKLAIVLTFVELVFLASIYLGAKFESTYILHISLFPVVILTFSSERFSKVATEKNYRTAFALTLRTLIVAGFAYLIYDSTFYSLLFQAFPELLFWIIGINLFLGKWIGLRLSEIYRFKSLLQ